MELPAVLSALVTGGTLGLVSTVHCAAMCGPLAAFARVGGDADQDRGRGLAWLAGRAAAYTCAGALAGTAGLALQALLPVRAAQAVVSLSLALALGALAFRLFGLPQGAARAPGAMARIEPPTGRLVPLASSRRPPGHASRLLMAAHGRPFLLGAAMALLPCGALALALGAAALPGTPWAGAVTMLAFAASSSAGLVLASTIAGAGGALDAFTRRALGVVLLVGAVVLGIRPLWALDGASPEAACHTAPGVHSGP